MTRGNVEKIAQELLEIVEPEPFDSICGVKCKDTDVRYLEDL